MRGRRYKNIRNEKEKKETIIGVIIALVIGVILVTVMAFHNSAPKGVEVDIPDNNAVVATSAEPTENVIVEEQQPQVQENAAAPVQESYTQKYTTTGLNIRKGIGTDAEILTAVPINTQLQTVDGTEQDGWIKIKYENADYYVNSKYLSDTKTEVKQPEKKETTSRSMTSAQTRSENPQPAAAGSLVGYYTLTYYCPCSQCCGKTSGITAWGTKAAAGRTIAAPSNFTFGTKLVINGHTYTVEDRGGAIKGNKIDVFVSTHAEAMSNGVKRNVPVYSAT